MRNFPFSIPLPDKSAKGVDVLSHSLDFPGVFYAFPPTTLLIAPGSFVSPRVAQAAMVQELSVAHAVPSPPHTGRTRLLIYLLSR